MRHCLPVQMFYFRGQKCQQQKDTRAFFDQGKCVSEFIPAVPCYKSCQYHADLVIVMSSLRLGLLGSNSIWVTSSCRDNPSKTDHFFSKFENSIINSKGTNFFPCLRFVVWHLKMLCLKPCSSIKDPRSLRALVD